MGASIIVRDEPENLILKMPARTLSVSGGTYGIFHLLGEVYTEIKSNYIDIFEKSLESLDWGQADWGMLDDSDFKLVLKLTIVEFEKFMTEFSNSENKNALLGDLQLWNQYMYYMTSDPRSGLVKYSDQVEIF